MLKQQKNIVAIVCLCGVLASAGIYAQPLLPYEDEFYKGNDYYHQQQYDEAIRAFSRAIKLNPTFAEAYNNRGLCYKAKGNINHALIDYNEALRWAPANAQLYVNRGRTYLDQDELSKAFADFSKAITLDRNCADAYSSRAIVYSLSGEYRKAWHDAHRAISLGAHIEENFVLKLKRLSGDQ